MKTKTTLVLNLLFIAFLSSCGNDDEGNNNIGNNNVNGTYTIEINGEVMDIESKTPAFYNYLPAVDNDATASYGLTITAILSDNTSVQVIFYNLNLDANNLNLGDYSTSYDDNNLFYVAVLTSNNVLYNSSYNDDPDIAKLTKCDLSTNKTSGEYEITITSPQTNETMHIKGLFTNESLIQQ